MVLRELDEFERYLFETAPEVSYHRVEDGSAVIVSVPPGKVRAISEYLVSESLEEICDFLFPHLYCIKLPGNRLQVGIKERKVDYDG